MNLANEKSAWDHETLRNDDRVEKNSARVLMTLYRGGNPVPTTRHRRLHWLHLFSFVLVCFLFLRRVNAQSGKKTRKVVTAVPPGADVTIYCNLPGDKRVIQRRWYRVSDSRDLFLNDIWLRHADVEGWPLKSDTYFAETNGDFYSLRIANVASAEAGEYRCKVTFEDGVVQDQVIGLVTVIRRPVCSPPKLPDLREGTPFFMNCSAMVFGGRVPKLQWSVGNSLKNSVREDGENRATAILEYKPAFKDYGSTARCVVQHPRWNHSYPVSSCEYRNLVVQFPPRLSCTKNRVAIKKAEDYRLWCNYTSYPPSTPRSFQWLTMDGQNLNHSMHKEVVRKINLGFQAVLVVKSQVFEKFDEKGVSLPFSDAQTIEYQIVIRDSDGNLEKQEKVTLTLDLNEPANDTTSDSVIGIMQDWRVLIGILAAFSALVIVIILVIIIIKKGFCKSEKSHDLNGTSGTELSHDGIGLDHELPVGAAFDVPPLDDPHVGVDGAPIGNNGVNHEFYHSGKNKGSLRFDRY